MDHVCDNFALLLMQISNLLYRAIFYLIFITSTETEHEHLHLSYPSLSNILGKLQEIIFFIHRGQWPIRPTAQRKRRKK